MKKGNDFNKDNFDPVMMALLFLILIGLGIMTTLMASGMLTMMRW